MKIEHHNPENMYKSPVFSQGTSVVGPARILYVGGQNGIDASGKMVGEDVASQTEQAVRNVLEVLKSVGATQKNVLKLTIYIDQNQDIREAFGASSKIWGNHPTAISGIRVVGLTVPGALIEVEAVAAVEA